MLQNWTHNLKKFMKFVTFLREGRFVKIVLASRRELNFRRSQGVDSEPNCVRSVIKIHLKNRHQQYLKIHHFGVPVGSHFGIILEPWMPHGTPGAPDGHLGSIFDPGCLLWDPFGGLLGSFGVLWVLFWGPLGLLWAPFGSILDTQGQLSRPSVAFWRPFAHLNVFFGSLGCPFGFLPSLWHQIPFLTLGCCWVPVGPNSMRASPLFSVI